MQLLPEPGRTDRSRPVELTPCDKAALFCASRLRKQNPSVHLTAAVVAAPPVCPDAAAVSILRNALALGADRGLIVRSPAVIPGPDFGNGLLQTVGQHTGTRFSVILTGFHMRPAVTDTAAAQQGFSWSGNAADLSLVPASHEKSIRPEEGMPVSAEVLVKKGEQLFSQKHSLPLLAEIVRSDIPPSQPTFLEIAEANQLPVETISYDSSLSDEAPAAFPLIFDTKKTAPSQIAADVLAVLRENRLVPSDSVSDSAVGAPGVSGEQSLLPGDDNKRSPSNPLVWADRIVSVGRGSIGPDGSADRTVQLAQTLAGCLGASFGSSKAAVDLGIMPAFCQVGKTSSIVNPDLYVACGISGSIQHQDGMRQSRFIVAVNSDPAAPIFRIADICILGDLEEVLTAFVSAAREQKSFFTPSGLAVPESSPRPSDGT